MIEKEIDNIGKDKVKDIVRERLVKIENGDRLSSFAAEQITATFQLQARIYPKTEY